MKPLRQALSPHNIAQTAGWMSYYARKALLTPFTRPHLSPVLVLGNQKSGTTAIADLLARQAGVRATIDIPALASDLPLRLMRGGRSFDEFVHRHRYDFSRPIVKEPWLTFLWDDLHRRFPQSPVLFIVRDPRQNARSILNRLGVRGDLDSLSATILTGMKPGWKAVFEMERDAHYIDALALRWNTAVEAYNRHSDTALLLRYEDFVADKAGTLGTTATEMGLPVKRDIGALVDRQYQPRGDRKAKPAEFFGENLSRIEELCAEGMAQFGY